MSYSWFPKIFTVRCIATYSTNKHVGYLGAELIYLSDIFVHFDLETHYQRKSYGLGISIFNMFTKLRDCVFSMMSNISRVNNWHFRYKYDLIEGKITLKTSSDITFVHESSHLHKGPQRMPPNSYNLFCIHVMSRRQPLLASSKSVQYGTQIDSLGFHSQPQSHGVNNSVFLLMHLIKSILCGGMFSKHLDTFMNICSLDSLTSSTCIGVLSACQFFEG